MREFASIVPLVKFVNLELQLKLQIESRLLLSRGRMNSVLTFRLPSFFCDIGYQGGGWLPPPPGFRVWFHISYLVIHQWIQHSIMYKMVYLVVHYVNAPRNYIIFNKGTDN